MAQKTNKKTKQLDDLNYLSAIAFDKYGFDEKDIEVIANKLNTKSKLQTVLATIFVAIISALFVASTLFFAWNQKGKNHQSIYQNLIQEKKALTLNNLVTNNDTVFPIIASIESKSIGENFHSSTNKKELGEPIDISETLVPINALIEVEKYIEPERELKFRFIANAPIEYIHNLKVTNYRLYYFKNNNEFNLDETSGLLAQYENASQMQKEYVIKPTTYLAHKMIQRAMKLYANNKYQNCIEELSLLYNYNKNDANAQFYLAMCYYQINKFEIAKSFFVKNLEGDNNIFNQESEFYLALCLLNTNKKNEATNLLQVIINNKGFYSDRAKTFLNK